MPYRVAGSLPLNATNNNVAVVLVGRAEWTKSFDMI